MIHVTQYRYRALYRIHKCTRKYCPIKVSLPDVRRLAPETPYLEGNKSQVYILIKLGKWNSRIPNAQCFKVQTVK